MSRWGPDKLITFASEPETQAPGMTMNVCLRTQLVKAKCVRSLSDAQHANRARQLRLHSALPHTVHTATLVLLLARTPCRTRARTRDLRAHVHTAPPARALTATLPVGHWAVVCLASVHLGPHHVQPWTRLSLPSYGQSTDLAVLSGWPRKMRLWTF